MRISSVSDSDLFNIQNARDFFQPLHMYFTFSTLKTDEAANDAARQLFRFFKQIIHFDAKENDIDQILRFYTRYFGAYFMTAEFMLREKEVAAFFINLQKQLGEPLDTDWEPSGYVAGAIRELKDALNLPIEIDPKYRIRKPLDPKLNDAIARLSQQARGRIRFFSDFVVHALRVMYQDAVIEEVLARAATDFIMTTELPYHQQRTSALLFQIEDDLMREISLVDATTKPGHTSRRKDRVRAYVSSIPERWRNLSILHKTLVVGAVAIGIAMVATGLWLPAVATLALPVLEAVAVSALLVGAGTVVGLGALGIHLYATLRHPVVKPPSNKVKRRLFKRPPPPEPVVVSTGVYHRSCAEIDRCEAQTRLASRGGALTSVSSNQFALMPQKQVGGSGQQNCQPVSVPSF